MDERTVGRPPALEAANERRCSNTRAKHVKSGLFEPENQRTLLTCSWPGAEPDVGTNIEKQDRPKEGGPTRRDRTPQRADRRVSSEIPSEAPDLLDWTSEAGGLHALTCR